RGGEEVVPRIGAREGEPRRRDGLAGPDVLVREAGRATGQRHAVGADHSGEGPGRQDGRGRSVVRLVVRSDGTGQRARGDVGRGGERARGQDVVGRVGARQSEAGGGHRLPGADVLGVEVRRTAGEGDHIAGQHPGQGAGGEDGGRGAVVALAVGGDLPGERD